MGIRVKNRDPKPTDFQKHEIIINGSQGSLFFKNSKNELKKLDPSNLVTGDPNSITTHTSNITTNPSNISTNTSNITSNSASLAASITTNTTNITTNTTNITSLSSSLSASVATNLVSSSKHITAMPFNFSLSKSHRNKLIYIPIGGTSEGIEEPDYRQSFFTPYSGSVKSIHFVINNADDATLSSADYVLKVLVNPNNIQTSTVSFATDVIPSIDTVNPVNWQKATKTFNNVVNKRMYVWIVDDNTFDANQQLLITFEGSSVPDNGFMYYAGTITIEYET